MASPFEIDLDGALIRGEADGIGIPVVFLHAGVADRRMWDEQMRELAAAGYHVISYDRRGYGETESPDVPFSHLIDLEAILDRLSIHAAILVGCSAGGGLAIDFALENPNRTIGLVLVGTSVSGLEQEEPPDEVQPVLGAYMTATEMEDWDTVNLIEAHLWLDGPLSDNGRVSGPARELFLQMNGRRLGHPQLSEEEEPQPAADSLHLITAPVLLVVGSLDFPDIIARHEDLSEEIENAFAVILEDTAHLASLERPDLFDPILLEFIEAVTGPAGAEEA